MPLNPDQIAQCASTYIQKLSTDAEARAGLHAVQGAAAVAAHVSQVTGMSVGADDVQPLADHLNANHSDKIEQLASIDPAVGVIVDGHA